MFHLGIVTNCFDYQLNAGQRLPELIARARRLGIREIELREGSLGESDCASESETGMVLSQLSRLPEQFHDVKFRVAIATRFLDPQYELQPASSRVGSFEHALQAAKLLTPDAPNLRLVDPRQLEVGRASLDSAALARQIALLARRVGAEGGVLSLENSLQPWDWFLDCFRLARKELGREASFLQLCYDPCNLLLSESVSPQATSVRSSRLLECTKQLQASEISMVHFKQSSQGAVLPALEHGDVDWEALGQVFVKLGCQWASLLEIAPGDQLWHNVALSQEYLRRIGYPI